MALIDVTVPGSFVDTDLLSALLKDPLLSSTGVKIQFNTDTSSKRSNYRPILVIAFIFLLITCLSRMYKLRRRLEERDMIPRNRRPIPATPLETDTSVDELSNSLFGPNSKIDTAKYLVTITKRKAGENYGPWGEKK